MTETPLRRVTAQGAREELMGCADAVPDVLLAFGRALDAAQGGLDWPYFLEKPWKWGHEYVVWCALGYPADGEPTFEKFTEAVS